MDKIGLCFVVGLLCVCGASAQNMNFTGGSGNMTGNFSFPYGSGSDIGSGEFSSRKILQLKFINLHCCLHNYDRNSPCPRASIDILLFRNRKCCSYLHNTHGF